jgi:hypothetical protein
MCDRKHPIALLGMADKSTQFVVPSTHGQVRMLWSKEKTASYRLWPCDDTCTLTILIWCLNLQILWLIFCGDDKQIDDRHIGIWWTEPITLSLVHACGINNCIIYYVYVTKQILVRKLACTNFKIIVKHVHPDPNNILHYISSCALLYFVISTQFT